MYFTRIQFSIPSFHLPRKSGIMLEPQTHGRSFLMARNWGNVDMIKKRVRPTTTLESRLLAFLEQFEAIVLRETAISRFFSTVTKQERFEVFILLHKFLLSQTDAQVCRNTICALSYFAQRTCLYLTPPEVAKFYVQLLLNTSGEEARFVSNIVACLYSALEFVRVGAREAGLMEFVLSRTEIEPYSGLILEVAREADFSSDEASIVAARVAELLPARLRDDVKADALEILGILLPKVDKRIFQDKVFAIETQVYSEIPRGVGSALRILAALDVPFTDLEMLFTFIESCDRRVAQPALGVLAKFAKLFNSLDQRVARRLFEWATELSYVIGVDCLHTLCYFERSPEQTDALLELLFAFAEGDDGSYTCLKCAKSIIGESSSGRVAEIVREHEPMLDSLLTSDNAEISEMANEILDFCV